MVSLMGVPGPTWVTLALSAARSIPVPSSSAALAFLGRQLAEELPILVAQLARPFQKLLELRLVEAVVQNEPGLLHRRLELRVLHHTPTRRLPHRRNLRRRIGRQEEHPADQADGLVDLIGPPLR